MEARFTAESPEPLASATLDDEIWTDEDSDQSSNTYKSYGTTQPTTNSNAIVYNSANADPEKGIYEPLLPKSPSSNPEKDRLYNLKLLIAFTVGLGNASNLAFNALGLRAGLKPSEYTIEKFLELPTWKLALCIASAGSSLGLNTVQNTIFNLKAVERITTGIKKNPVLAGVTLPLGIWGALPSFIIALSGFGFAPAWVAYSFSTLTLLCFSATRFIGLIDTATKAKNYFNRDLQLQTRAAELLNRIRPEVIEKAKSEFNFNSDGSVHGTLSHETFLKVMQWLDTQFNQTEAAQLQKEIDVILMASNTQNANYVSLKNKLASKNPCTPLIQEVLDIINNLDLRDDSFEADKEKTFAYDHISTLLDKKAFDTIFIPKTSKEELLEQALWALDSGVSLGCAFLAFVVFGQKGIDGLIKLEELISGGKSITELSQLQRLFAGVPSGLISSVFYGKTGFDLRETLLASIRIMIDSLRKLPKTTYDAVSVGSATLAIEAAKLAGIATTEAAIMGASVLGGDSIRAVGKGILSDPNGVWHGALFPPYHDESMPDEHPGTDSQHQFADSFPDAAGVNASFINYKNVAEAFNNKIKPSAESGKTDPTLQELSKFEKTNSFEKTDSSIKALSQLSMFQNHQAHRFTVKLTPQEKRERSVNSLV